MAGEHPYTRAARAISARAARQARAERRESQYADVLRIDPLRARRHDTDEIVDEGDDLVLGQWARTYHAQVGITTDDTLVFHPMPDDTIVVVEVLSDADVS